MSDRANEQTIRAARSEEALERLLSGIESGRDPKPDWIRLEGKLRLDRIKPARRAALLARIHACVLRGFKANNVDIKSKKARSAYWRSVASAGFHDFTEFGWMKCYDSPFVENYDYVGAFVEGGLEALDPYAVYSAVLGTHEFGVEDFIATDLCKDVRTIVEPMAGTAEFSYNGHFRYPDFQYLMIDLDETAQQRVLAQRWLPDAKKAYLVHDVLDEEIWKQVKSMTIGDSLCYIGKQSHHLFDAKQLFHFMDVSTRYVDYLMLETPQICLVSDMGETDELSREEMEDAGFTTFLATYEDGEPNPMTNLMHFTLEARAGKDRRMLFEYLDWTNWSQPTLVAFADMLDLQSYYFHSETEEFCPTDEWDGEADCEENVTFMLFTKRKGSAPTP